MFESNDTFVEQAVKSNETGKQKGLKVFFAIMVLVSAFFMFSFSFIIGFILVVVFGILFILQSNKSKTEYEYDYTNGTLDIARITNNSKRKRILSIEAAEVRLVAPMGTNEALKYDHLNLKSYNCSANDPEVRNFILVAHDTKKNEDFQVIWNPNEKLLNAMKRYNKRDIIDM